MNKYTHRVGLAAITVGVGYGAWPPVRIGSTPHGIAAALKAEAPDVAKFIYHCDVRAGWRCFKRDARKIRMARHRRRGWGRS